MSGRALQSAEARGSRPQEIQLELRRDNSRLVASLDRKRLGQDTSGGRRSWSEAFSIRRLGGSRWCLRRTRCAMGFERHFGIQQVDGRAREKRVKIVVYVAQTGKSVDGRL